MENNANIDIMMREYENLSQFIRTLMQSTYVLIVISLTILFTGFGVAITENNILVFLIPFGIFASFFYGMYIYTTILSLGGYKKHLEEQINSLFPNRVLKWEYIARKHVHFSKSAIMIIILGFSFLVLSICKAVTLLPDIFLSKVLYVSALTICTVYLLLSLRHLSRVFIVSYYEAKNHYKK